MPPEQAVVASLPASRLAGLRRKLCQAIAAFEDTGDTSSDAACLIQVRFRDVLVMNPELHGPRDVRHTHSRRLRVPRPTARPKAVDHAAHVDIFIRETHEAMRDDTGVAAGDG